MQAVAAPPRAEPINSQAACPGGVPRTAFEIIALGSLLACIAAEAAVLRTGIDDLDEGYFLQQATRVYRYGQMPYRDFESLYTPGLTYLHAALFWLAGGIWLLGPRLLALGGRAALVGLMYLLARPLVRNPLWAAAPGVVLLLAFDNAPARWEPHPGWLSSVCALIAVWCLTHRPSRVWLLAAGAAAAGAYLFKQNTGVFILAAIVLQCGFAWRRALLAVAAFVGCTAVWLVPLLVGVGNLQILAGFVGVANVGSLYAPPEPTLLVPLAGLVAGLVVVRRQAAWLLLAGSCLFLTELPRMDTLHLVWSAPLLLVVGAVALERMPRGLSCLSFVVVALLASPNASARIDLLQSAQTHFLELQVPPQTAADLRAALDAVSADSPAGEPIFVYPTSPLVYVLADRPNPTRFDHLNPGAASPSQVQEVMADLERANMHVVVVSDFWRNAWGPPGNNVPVEGWIATNFRTGTEAGSYRVLRRL